MKVTFYYRRPNPQNKSIERVFENVERGLKSEGISIGRVYARSYGFWPLSMLINMFRTGFLGWTRKGIHHITGDIHYCALLMPSSRTVLTIHDLVSLHNAEISHTFKKFVYYFWYYFPLLKLKKITCISEATKQDLIKYFPFTASRLTVISNPVDSFLFDVKPKIEIPVSPVILHIGTRPNKNLKRVIVALSGLKCQLRIIGELDDSMIEELRKYTIDYSSASGLTDEQIINEYRNCDIVSFPSTFEGFGMPIIEAQAASRPVVTSDIEPMKSVAAEGAILVNPTSVSSIRAGFSSLISDENLRRNLVQKGLKNAKKYSTEDIAGRYTRLYERQYLD